MVSSFIGGGNGGDQQSPCRTDNLCILKITLLLRNWVALYFFQPYLASKFTFKFCGKWSHSFQKKYTEVRNHATAVLMEAMIDVLSLKISVINRRQNGEKGYIGPL